MTLLPQYIKSLATNAGEIALKLFNNRLDLKIETKGTNDWVSNADKEVEQFIRNSLLENRSTDTIIGEEFPHHIGTSEFTWVIDPIDGTTNYINGIPCWSVVIALCKAQSAVMAVTFNPVTNEMFFAEQGCGATCNNKTIKVNDTTELKNGSVGVGRSSRVSFVPTRNLLNSILENGGMFYHNASGAEMLAYVAAGRLVGYCEQIMNAWDCIGGLLLIKEAGGKINSEDHSQILSKGARIIVGSNRVYSQLYNMASFHYNNID